MSDLEIIRISNTSQYIRHQAKSLLGSVPFGPSKQSLVTIGLLQCEISKMLAVLPWTWLGALLIPPEVAFPFLLHAFKVRVSSHRDGRDWLPWVSSNDLSHKQ